MGTKNSGPFLYFDNIPLKKLHFLQVLTKLIFRLQKNLQLCAVLVGQHTGSKFSSVAWSCSYRMVMCIYVIIALGFVGKVFLEPQLAPL